MNTSTVHEDGYSHYHEHKSTWRKIIGVISTQTRTSFKYTRQEEEEPCQLCGIELSTLMHKRKRDACVGCAVLIPILCTSQPLSTPMPNKTTGKWVCIPLPGEAVYIDLVLNPCTCSPILARAWHSINCGNFVGYKCKFCRHL